ncbi:biopolymer transporter ExbD [Glaciecola sp. MH2013]|uniref:ExbD/TolR family protein n=1 Tax=Glaciecola sp. MH2013 TaxID=2785524 RepID=UPI00189C5B6C|nr:biopolymer transporter ExbD [Glaciecola sp. MH2013]MBF7072443.1 biopolymer transporter ExbD [Glaciecola sp. MH2013]
MGRKVREQEEDAQIDMTPMLDVVFIMLIFFIVTTVFVKQAGMEVNKPDGETAVLKKKANIFIAITESGDVWMDRREISVEAVGANLEKLLAEQPSEVVFIQADSKAKHGIVVKVMDQVKEAGIDRVAIAVRS